MPVNPLQLIQIPLVLALVALLVLAVLYDQRKRKAQQKKKETLYRCKGCRLIYTATRHTPTARCPSCGKQNHSVRSH